MVTLLLRSARVSVALVFLIHGILVSSWLARIPAVQRDLGLSSSVLGFALLGAAVGAFTAIVGIPPLQIRFGSARVTTWSSFGLCAVLPLPALASGAISLAGVLFVYGSLSCGRSGCRRNCSSPFRIVMSSSPCRAPARDLPERSK